jgi:hypothetical protein
MNVESLLNPFQRNVESGLVSSQDTTQIQQAKGGDWLDAGTYGGTFGPKKTLSR